MSRVGCRTPGAVCHRPGSRRGDGIDEERRREHPVPAVQTPRGNLCTGPRVRVGPTDLRRAAPSGERISGRWPRLTSSTMVPHRLLLAPCHRAKLRSRRPAPRCRGSLIARAARSDRANRRARAIDDPPEDRAERLAIGRGEIAEDRRSLAETLGETPAEPPPGLCEHEVPDPPIGRVGPPLEEAAGFESADDAGHVRGIAAEPLGDAAHRRRPRRLEALEHLGLGLREPEIGADRRAPRAVGGDDLEKQAPGLAGSAFPTHDGAFTRDSRTLTTSRTCLRSSA